MPPLDDDDVGFPVLHDDGGAELEAAACGCETALSTDDQDPYAPAESLRLRIGEDIDWSDVVVGAVAAAAVLERDDSTKGAAANPKCAARRSSAAAATAMAARSSLSAPPRAAVAAVVIGGLPMPAAAGKAVSRDRDRDHGRRRSPCRLQLQLGGGTRVFAASGEAAAGRHHAEPGSPKVSCLGGVRSQPRTTAAAEGVTSGRRWWAWLAADVMSCCGWKGRRSPRQEADAERSRVE